MIINLSENVENQFLKMALLFGLLFIFLIPPFQMADEDSHFKKAYSVSHFDMLPESNKEGKLGNFIPKALLEFENNNNYMRENIEAKYNYKDFYFDFALPGNYSDVEFIEYHTANTHPILYFPQSTMIFIFSLLSSIFYGDGHSLPPLTIMHAGRLGNLLFFIACSYYSIKIIPFYKNLLLLICLMPMTVCLASSLSYDSMVIGISILFLSVILNYSFNKEFEAIKLKDIIILSIFSILLVELKQVYFPLIFLYFLIPKNKFNNVKSYYLSFITIFSVGIIMHILWILISKVVVAAPGEINYFNEQLNFILSNPISFLMVIFNTIKEYSFFYVNSFIGNIGWLDTNFPIVFVCLYVFVLMLAGFIDTNEEIIITISQKVYLLILFIGIFILLEASLYLIWTALPFIGGIGYRVVSGVQGRYFIPIILLFIMTFYSNTINKGKFSRFRKFFLSIVPTIALYSCLLTLITILLRYWI